LVLVAVFIAVGGTAVFVLVTSGSDVLMGAVVFVAVFAGAEVSVAVFGGTGVFVLVGGTTGVFVAVLTFTGTDWVDVGGAGV